MSHASVSQRQVLAAVVSTCALLAVGPAPAQATIDSDALASGDATVAAHLQALSDAHLKTFFLTCSDLAHQRVLDGREAALCSMAYEVLLKRSFASDFEALQAWWRPLSTEPPLAGD